MRVSFVANSYLDPRSASSWSGLPHFIMRSLERAGIEVVTTVLPEPNPTASMLRFAYWRLLRGRRYIRSCDRRLLRHYASRFERHLSSIRADVVFCPSSWPVAYLRTKVPVVFWTDACFAGMLNFYESFTNLAPCSITDGHAAELSALENCARAIYSSDWAAATARESYNADPAKMRVVPFGGNLAERPSIEEVDASISRRGDQRCDLLLIGVDWVRKGAQIAVDAVRSLNDRGFPARLTIVGCPPPNRSALPSYVEIIPFINKGTSDGARRFKEICLRSHFMIMPSRADCTPVAIAEANYFGLPCLTTDVGGIPSIVTDNVNGRMFDLRTGGAEYAEYILTVMRDRRRYLAFAAGAAAFADRNLSWDRSGTQMAAILREVVAEKSAAGFRAPLSVPSGMTRPVTL
jgi:glycosyltransferase involved in cell wall biosynthesis